jgi:site-specific recombinase XerC
MIDAAMIMNLYATRLKADKANPMLLDNEFRMAVIELHQDGFETKEIAKGLSCNKQTVESVIRDGLPVFEPREWRCPSCGSLLCVAPCHLCEMRKR